MSSNLTGPTNFLVDFRLGLSYTIYMLKKQLNQIKDIYLRLYVPWVEPYHTTVADILNGNHGNHTGHYLIGDNYYFGRAVGSQSVKARFRPHYAKLNARFDWLFAAQFLPTEECRTKIHRSSAHWKMGEGWKDLHRDILIDNCPEFPTYFRKTERGYEAGDFYFPARPNIDIDSLEVQVWDLSHLDEDTIKRLEKEIIRQILPYANAETHRWRRKMFG